MAINQLSTANTFQHWLIATQQLIAFANSVTDGPANTTFNINNSLVVTGLINAQNGIVTTNITSSNVVTNEILTINLVSSSIDTQNISVNNANINVANVNTITFADGSVLSSNSFITDLTNLGQAGYNKANSANVLAQAAFDKANTASANTINATSNLLSTTSYPVMVAASDILTTTFTTPSKFAFNGVTGRLTLDGPYLTKGLSSAVEYADRSGGTVARYSSYVTGGKFYIYDHVSLINSMTISSGVFNFASNVGIGSSKTSPNATLDWCETVSVHSSGSVSARSSRTYVLTGSTIVTLPASPNIGDWIKICNRGSTLTSTLSRNGSNIMGAAEDFTVDLANVSFSLTYVDSSNGWVIT